MILFDIVLFVTWTLLAGLAGGLIGYSRGFLNRIPEYEQELRRQKIHYERRIQRIEEDIDNEGWKRER